MISTVCVRLLSAANTIDVAASDYFLFPQSFYYDLLGAGARR